MKLDTIGKNIRKFREIKKLRQEDLAEKTDLTTNYIGMIDDETFKANSSINIIFLLSTNFLGLRHKYYAITITVSDDNTQSVIERNYNMEEILKQIALENRTTVGSVKKEIEFAIHEAMNNSQTDSKNFWNELSYDGKEPSVETVIAALVSKVICEINS